MFAIKHQLTKRANFFSRFSWHHHSQEDNQDSILELDVFLNFKCYIGYSFRFYFEMLPFFIYLYDKISTDPTWVQFFQKCFVTTTVNRTSHTIFQSKKTIQYQF